VTKSRAFLLEEAVEALSVDLCALEKGPGVGVGIGGVDGADEVSRQAFLGLVPVEGLEGRGGEDPAEVPDHRLDAHALFSLGLRRRS
jgi:hypothetical protein